MQKLQNLKLITFIYAIIQFSFMLFYTPLTGSFDLFPLFTWNIFRPYPDKPVWHHVILIKEINGIVIVPPREIVHLPIASFKNISFYSYTHRIQMWGEALKNKDNAKALEIKREIDEDFLVFNQNLIYSLEKIKINPIDYKIKGETLERVVLNEWRLDREDKIQE